MVRARFVSQKKADFVLKVEKYCPGIQALGYEHYDARKPGI